MGAVEPSPWVSRFASLVPRGGRVLDVACGGGRHTRFFLARGHRVTAVDRDTSGVADLSGDVGPQTPYGPQRDLAHLSKIYGEQALAIAAARDGFGLSILRLGIVYGPSPVEHDAEESQTDFDLEAGAPFPFRGRAFDGVVVTNYLHRPILPDLVAVVAAGGVLLYETFAKGQERFGRPHRPEFLLEPGELLEAVRGVLRVVAYEDIVLDELRPAAVQRIAAVREP